MFLNARQLRETVPIGGFDDISLDKAELVAIFLESFIYGTSIFKSSQTLSVSYHAQASKP
jgi:hypothetical protein